MEEGRPEELRTQSWYRAGLVVCASRPTVIIIGGPAINRPKYAVRLKLCAVNMNATGARAYSTCCSLRPRRRSLTALTSANSSLEH